MHEKFTGVFVYRKTVLVLVDIPVTCIALLKTEVLLLLLTEFEYRCIY